MLHGADTLVFVLYNTVHLNNNIGAHEAHVHVFGINTLLSLNHLPATASSKRRACICMSEGKDTLCGGRPCAYMHRGKGGL